MLKKVLFFILFCFSLISTFSQTTDLAVVVAAQNLNGTPVSQVQIYQQFQYIVTLINSGNTVSNATFNLDLNDTVVVNAFSSQNNSGGATNASNINLGVNNILTGTVANLPSNSSVEVKIIVNAPTQIGGIAIHANILPPNDTEDINTSNNQSIISIDVVDITIDFTVTHSQISPIEGTAINAWNDLVTYDFTITNNSSIAFPLDGFNGLLELYTPFNFGQPIAQLVSLECLGGTNGTNCPDVTAVTGSPTVISAVQNVFSFGTPHEFTSGGSLTFRSVYQYFEPLCGLENDEPIQVNSFIKLNLNHDNLSSNNSNTVTTHLLTADLCAITDICIETIQISPDVSTVVNWEQEVTFETTVCNMGPLDAPILFFLQNLSVGVEWEIISVECIETTGNITCNDFSITIAPLLWASNDFIMPVDATIKVRSVVKFFEPECSTSTTNTIAHVRSGTNLLSNEIIDINVTNSAESDYVTLPPTGSCPSSDLQITKTQISPMLPEGSSANNTTSWGAVTYEITASNLGDNDTVIELSDYTTLISGSGMIGTLTAIECVSTTGTATCFEIEHANIGIPQDCEPQDGDNDVFWEILPEDNWILPAQSSVTFQATINWEPECSEQGIIAINHANINHVGPVIDSNNSNNLAQSTTFFAPCIDLIVQTFPELTQVSINQNFNWIIDISNSTTSSNAIDVYFEDVLDAVFTINGNITCEITSGNASCITNISITNNLITGTIPNMEASSTIRIKIPVTAPSFGGAFNNTSQAMPSEINNEELTPETNISISNIQVIAPIVLKKFNPDTIIEGQESTLTFTITNIPSNPEQTNITFTDQLPPGVFLSGNASWVSDNGCTATFIGNTGDNFVGVTNLSFPEGVESCAFSVPVTSNIIDTYLNNFLNFSNQTNIDTSQAEATLTVIEDTSNVDIEVLKTVFPEEASIGDEVTFTITITNLGSTLATEIDIYENLPSGYQFVDSNTSLGIYNSEYFLWQIGSLSPNQSETLTITALVLSSEHLLNTANLYAVNEPDRNDTNNESTAQISIYNCLQISEGLSPNNDTYNDFLVIPCIEKYPNNSIKIYNRLGVQIYQSTDYKNNWDGKPNMGFPDTNHLLPVGTYYYILELDDNVKPITGWIYLNY